jgi:hypothetical protein
VAGLAARRVGGRIFRQQAGKTREMRGPLPLPSHRVAAVAACSTHPASTFPTPHSLSLTHSLTHFLTHYLIRAQHSTSSQPWSTRARSSPAPSACWPSSGRAPCRGATWTESESLPLTHSLTHFVSYFLTHSLTPLLGTLPPRCLGESPLWCARKP